LPERFTGSAQHQIRFTGGPALDSPYRFAGFNERSNQQVNMVCHHYPSVQLIESLVVTSANTRANEISYPRLPQPHRACASRIEVAVHPDEGPASRKMTRRRIAAFREAPVEMPSDEENAPLWLPVGQAAAWDFHLDQWCAGVNILTGA